MGALVRRTLSRGLSAAAAALMVLGVCVSAAPAGASNIPVTGCAKNPDGTLAPGCFAMELSPARVIPPPLAAGQTFTQVFTLIDKGNVDYTVDVSAVEYTQEANGAYNMESTGGEASKWVTISPAFVPMGGSNPKTAQVTVTVRPDPSASSGDHNVGIVFKKQLTVTGGSGIHVQQQIAAQMPVLVPGVIVHGLRLLDVKATTKHSLFGVHLPGTWTKMSMTVVNTGSVHQDFYSPEDLSGTVSGFGAPAGEVLTAPRFTVLRDSKRDVVTTWDGSTNFSTSSRPFYCWCRVTWTAHASEAVPVTSDSSSPAVSWTAVKDAQSYTVERNGVTVSPTLPGSTVSWTDPHPVDGAVYTVAATVATAVGSTVYHVLPIPEILIGLLILIVLVWWLVRSVRRWVKRGARREEKKNALRAEILAELATPDE